MRIIFLGTPDFAVPPLKALIGAGHTVVAVVTQPDRQMKKGILLPCPVKAYALTQNIKVLQYEKISKEGVADLQKIDADIMITAAFGQILSDEILKMKKYGVINVHGSLLPKYRGASPIQTAILQGEKETGITIMQTAKAVDSGDIIYILKTHISDDETAGELFDRLSFLGGEALLTCLDMIQNGTAIYSPQIHEEATFCKMLTKDSGRINWNTTYDNLSSFIRAMIPWPSPYSFLNEKRVKIIKISKISNDIINDIGTVIVADTKLGVHVQIADSVIRLNTVQFENSKEMTDIECVCGRKFTCGDKFHE